MPRSLYSHDTATGRFSFSELVQPLKKILFRIPKLESRGYRPLKMTFEQQLNALIYFHLEEHTSGRHLVQVLQEEDFARSMIAPPDGIHKSSFFEAVNTRGLEQLTYVFNQLYAHARTTLPHQYGELGELVSIDGSLINAVFSMHWADYRNGAKKAKAHLGFDLNRSIPSKIFLTDGKTGERPFFKKIIKKDQTGVMDRGYQCHENFDQWQAQGKHFICRITATSTITCLRTNTLVPDSIVFYDAIVLLGMPRVNQTKKEVRVIKYRIHSKDYWIATDRFDLTAEQISEIYRLRWNIETFFAWWKQHLSVYHLIARSKYGFMVQILAGLITYLLLAIYCRTKFNEHVSIKRVRELQIKIKNETPYLLQQTMQPNLIHNKFDDLSAKT